MRLRRSEGARHAWRRFALFLAILGPGVITANVDNDAGGITTYSQAGARYGLATLWLFIPLAIAVIVVQEMANRMGVVSGKGLSDLIRERFGARWTFYLMLALLLTNFGNILAEFAGIAAAGEIFGVSRLITVPLAALAVWLIVVRSSYRTVEKVFLAAVVLYVSYILAGILSHPSGREIAHALTVPRFIPESQYLIMLVALIGTTIAPWMQFYQQAAVAEKNVRVDDYALSRLDTILGGISVSVVAAFIVIVCAINLYGRGLPIESAGDAARALAPIAGRYAGGLFAFGLLNASMFAAVILPLSTAYTICEGFGWESGVDKGFTEAPQFYVLFSALMALGAGLIMLPGISLIAVMYLSQVINGLMLPFVLVFMLILINDRAIMGAHANSMWMNAVTVLLAAALSALGLAAGGLAIFGQ